jgi:hypothetical protein
MCAGLYPPPSAWLGTSCQFLVIAGNPEHWLVLLTVPPFWIVIVPVSEE